MVLTSVVVCVQVRERLSSYLPSAIIIPEGTFCFLNSFPTLEVTRIVDIDQEMDQALLETGSWTNYKKRLNS